MNQRTCAAGRFEFPVFEGPETITNIVEQAFHNMVTASSFINKEDKEAAIAASLSTIKKAAEIAAAEGWD